MKYWFCFCLLLMAACQTSGPDAVKNTEASGGAEEPVMADEAQLDIYLAQYAPYEMFFDASGLPEADKALLKKLVEAAKVVDEIYWAQTSRAGWEYLSLLANREDPQSQKALTLVKRNGGPYEQLSDNAVFVGETPFYGGGEVYPRGMTAAAFDAHLENLDEAARAEFMYPYTVIEEDADGGYRAPRYHQAYKPMVDRLAALLREAAELTDNASFATYLTAKADAVLSDNYFDADVAWIDLSGNRFDMVVGPFETYSDGIKGIKAKYEAYVEIVDQEESAKLEVYKQHLAAMEDNLPVEDVYKSKVGGLTAKFVIVRDIYRGGEAGVGYQAVAANLPNDPRVHAEKGTVKTFWKNMFTARFDKIIKPVSQVLIVADQQPSLSSEGFFMFVLMHEICHAIGPRTVKVGDNVAMAANASIGPAYNGLEEAKADIVGLLSLAYLMDNGIVDAGREREFYVSYLGSLFRSIRFGTGQAHGKAAAVELNYLRDQDAIRYDEEAGTWSVNMDGFRTGVKNLSRDLVMLLGDGDAAKVDAFFTKWMVMTPQLEASLARVSDLPIDVLPTYKIKWE